MTDGSSTEELVVAIDGPSGSGKSTIARIVVGSTGANVVLGDDGEADYTAGILTNYNRDQLGTLIPFTGNLNGPQVGLCCARGSDKDRYHAALAHARTLGRRRPSTARSSPRSRWPR